MDLGPDLTRDKADNPFAVGRSQPFAGVRKPVGKPFNPDAAIRIEHDLDDRRIFGLAGDRGSQHRVQHAGPMRHRFLPERIGSHDCPRASPARDAAREPRIIRKARSWGYATSLSES